MKIASKIQALMALAALSGGMPPMYEPKNITEPTPNPNKSIKPLVLSGLKHIGDVPKGCRLVQSTISFNVKQPEGVYSVEVIVDIIAGTNKSFNQKLLRKEKEILNYVNNTNLVNLMQDSRFKVTEYAEVEVSGS